MGIYAGTTSYELAASVAQILRVKCQKSLIHHVCINYTVDAQLSTRVDLQQAS